MINYLHKYLKYKNKYKLLKLQLGGNYINTKKCLEDAFEGQVSGTELIFDKIKLHEDLTGGQNSQIYKGNCKNFPFVLKIETFFGVQILYTIWKENPNLDDTRNILLHYLRSDQTECNRGEIISKILSQYVIQGKSPHFPLIYFVINGINELKHEIGYSYKKLVSDIMERYHNEEINRFLMTNKYTFMEVLDINLEFYIGDLKEKLKHDEINITNFNNQIIYILLQCCFALTFAKSKISLVHNDISLLNYMAKYTSTMELFYYYEDGVIKIPTNKLIIKLIDYSMSGCNSPGCRIMYGQSIYPEKSFDPKYFTKDVDMQEYATIIQECLNFINLDSGQDKLILEIFGDYFDINVTKGYMGHMNYLVRAKISDIKKFYDWLIGIGIIPVAESEDEYSGVTPYELF